MISTTEAVFVCFLVFVVVCSIIYASERDHAFRQEIRAARCAEMGENMPKDMEKYCDDTGV
jgi:hypothetical protein